MRQHGQDGFAGFVKGDVGLNIQLVKFGTLHEGDFDKGLDIGQVLNLNIFEEGGVDADFFGRHVAHKRTEFDTGVVITALIFHELFLEADETFSFVEDAERRKFFVGFKLVEELVDAFAFFQQSQRGVTGVLCGGNLEICSGYFELEVLGGTALLFNGDQGLIFRLGGIQISKTEVDQAQR